MNRLRKEVLAARLVWSRVAPRIVFGVLVTGAIMSASREAAMRVNRERGRAVTRWIAVPELCESTEGVWKRCTWVRR